MTDAPRGGVALYHSVSGSVRISRVLMLVQKRSFFSGQGIINSTGRKVASVVSPVQTNR